MKKPRNEFHEAAIKGLKCARKLVTDFELLVSMCEQGEDIEAFQYSFAIHGRICKLFKIGNYLPAFTGDPEADKMVEEVIREEIPIDIGFTEQGWFLMRMPLLLPKKEKGKGDIKHLRAILGASFRKAFHGAPLPVRFSNCTIIYRHVYDQLRPERVWRDHDNIEINFVTDMVAMYVMTDDAPYLCEHHYCSAAGSSERTEVYVIPQDDMCQWLQLRNSIPDEGVKITEIRPFEA